MAVTDTDFGVWNLCAFYAKIRVHATGNLRPLIS